MSNQDGFTEYVGRVIDAERVAARLSVDELAELSGVPKRTLYRILGAERDITVRQLSQVAPVLGLQPSDIFADAERRLARDAPRSSVDEIIDSAKELTERQKQALKDTARTNHLPLPLDPSGDIKSNRNRDASGGASRSS